MVFKTSKLLRDLLVISALAICCSCKTTSGGTESEGKSVTSLGYTLKLEVSTKYTDQITGYKFVICKESKCEPLIAHNLKGFPNSEFLAIAEKAFRDDVSIQRQMDAKFNELTQAYKETIVTLDKLEKEKDVAIDETCERFAGSWGTQHDIMPSGGYLGAMMLCEAANFIAMPWQELNMSKTARLAKPNSVEITKNVKVISKYFKDVFDLDPHRAPLKIDSTEMRQIVDALIRMTEMDSGMPERVIAGRITSEFIKEFNVSN